MYQNDNYQAYDEEEIDLKILFYKALVHWRKAIVVGIVIALLAAGWSLYGSLSRLNDEETYTKALESFNRSHQGWEASEEVYNNQIISLKSQQSAQQEYNENSVLMRIDPMNEWVGSVSYYVDSKYVVDPNSSIQAKDNIDKLLAAYSSYIQDGQLYEELLSKGTIKSVKYLQEILTCNIDKESASITITVLGPEKQNVEKMISLIKYGISAQAEKINGSVADHAITETCSIEYLTVDLELQEVQQKNINAVKAYDVSISEVNDKLINWTKSKEPEFDYSVSEIVKNAIKYALIGGVVGVFLTCCYYAVLYLMSGKFAAEHLKACGGNYILATIYKDTNLNEKKFLSGIDNWLKKSCGIDACTLVFDDGCKLLASNINGLIPGNSGVVVAIGAVDEKLAKEIEAACVSNECQDGQVSIKYLGNILADSKAVDALSEYSDVCIFAVEGQNTKDEVVRQYENLRKWGKNNLGIVIVKE